MGLWFARAISSSTAEGVESCRLLILGLDNAGYHLNNQFMFSKLTSVLQTGKTTILHMLKQNENIITIPTIGFNVETLQTQKGVSFTGL